MHDNHVATAWLEFSKHCLPKDCSLIQRNETMKAFYSGFMVGVLTITQAEEDEVVEKYRAIHRELTLFGKEIEEGII